MVGNAFDVNLMSRVMLRVFYAVGFTDSFNDKWGNAGEPAEESEGPSKKKQRVDEAASSSMAPAKLLAEDGVGVLRAQLVLLVQWAPLRCIKPCGRILAHYGRHDGP